MKTLSCVFLGVGLLAGAGCATSPASRSSSDPHYDPNHTTIKQQQEQFKDDAARMSRESLREPK